jgi:hypothetical protein
MQPPVRERPVGMHQLGAQVLIAAILLPVIRADGMTPAGACREWPKPKIPDDRRGGERVWRAAKGTNRSAQFRRPTRVAAADAVRPQAAIFIPRGELRLMGQCLSNRNTLLVGRVRRQKRQMI